MDLLVLASSSFRDKKLLFDTLDGLSSPVECIYSVGETCHEWLEEYCREKGLPFVTNFAQWYKDGKYDKAAGFNNKYHTIQSVENVLFLWDGHSEGLLRSIEMAKRLKKKAKLVKYEDELAGYYLFSGPNHPFSLDYPCEINVKGRVFHSARHLLAWWCAVKRKHDGLAADLLKLDFTKKSAAAKLKDIAEQVIYGANNPELEKGLTLINKTKFANKDLRKFLADTKGDIVFCGPAPYGIGMGKTAEEVRDKDKWAENKLGVVLTKLRNDCKASE